MSTSPVLVAYDGRCPATLQAATTLARALGLDIMVASAYQHEVIGHTQYANQSRFGRAESMLAEAVTPIDGVRIETRTLPADDIPDALRELAVEIDATAIVAGPDLQGDVTRRLASSAPCPVLVAPEDPRLVVNAYHEIGVAYDGSIGSNFALTAATDLAVRSGARVHVISVYTDAHHAEATELVAEHAAVGLDRVETAVDVRYGNVGRQLRAACRDLDLVICGSHGYGAVRRALLGSVSAELLDLPLCPVLVVPPKVRRRGGTALGLSTAA